MSNGKYLKEMINVTREKRGLLNEMLLLTREQQEIIVHQDMDQLNRLIDEKQKRIEIINSLDDRFEKGFENLKSQFGIKDISELLGKQDEEIKELKAEINEVMTIIGDIKSLEKENSLKLDQEKKEVSNKIQDIKRSKLAANKFFNSKAYAPPNPAFFDKKK